MLLHILYIYVDYRFNGAIKWSRMWYSEVFGIAMVVGVIGLAV